MEEPLFRAEIEPVRIPGSIFAVSVRVTNISQTQQLYAPFLLPGLEGKLENALFEVVDAAGEKLRYRGLRKKRGPPDFTTFLPVGPGAGLEFVADLTTGWNFEHGVRPHYVRYSVINPHPDPAMPLQRVKSPWMILPP